VHDRTIDFGLTQWAAVPGVARAREAVDLIDAYSSAGRTARRRGAFIDIRLAEAARVTRNARAREAVDRIGTRAAVAAGGGAALIDVRLTECTAVTGGARANDAVDQIGAHPTVHAGTRRTLCRTDSSAQRETAHRWRSVMVTQRRQLRSACARPYH
jgi:hypothetical protein